MGDGITGIYEGVPVMRIIKGQKLWMANEEACLKMEKRLNALGIKTRVGCTCETDCWSIYIISVPDEIVNTEVKL
jgi:hypothetical protein